MFTSYSDAGVFVAIGLVNDLAVTGRRGRDALDAISSILEFDPPTHDRLRPRHVPGFVALAATLHDIVRWLDGGDLDAAAQRLNELLADHPANPHLAKENGQWQLHHHPATLDLVPMYTSICAEILARLVGTGASHRLGLCAEPACGRAYLDQSRNSSRRYCSLPCQNRAKTAAFRARQRQRAR
jgi:predicted RNA-binding Zn ribbon-like protein